MLSTECFLAYQAWQARLARLNFYLVVQPVKLRKNVFLQFHFDVSPGNKRQAPLESQGGKPTLSESIKK